MVVSLPQKKKSPVFVGTTLDTLDYLARLSVHTEKSYGTILLVGLFFRHVNVSVRAHGKLVGWTNRHIEDLYIKID